MPEGGKYRTRKAVALRYLPELPAPFIVAKAEGRLAERLVAIAEDAGLPIIRSEGLVEALYPIDIDEYLPEVFYEVLAKIFAFIRTIEAP